MRAARPYSLKAAPLEGLAELVGESDETRRGWEDMEAHERLQALHDRGVWPILDHRGEFVATTGETVSVEGATVPAGSVLYQCSRVTQGPSRQRRKFPKGEPLALDPTPGWTLSEGWDFDLPLENRFVMQPPEVFDRIMVTRAWRRRDGKSLRAEMDAPLRAAVDPADREGVRRALEARTTDPEDPVEEIIVPLAAAEEDDEASGWVIDGEPLAPMRFQGRRG